MALAATRRGVAATKLHGIVANSNLVFRYGTTASVDEPTGDETTWELNAGDSIQLHFRWNPGSTGVIPNKLTRVVYYETGTGTVVRTFATDAAFPAAGASNGVTDTFHATSDGTATGQPRAGTLRLFIRTVKDDGPAGAFNFNVNSDDSPAETHDAVNYNAVNSYAGVLRSNMKVSDLTVNAYPAGSTFAYPDTVTLTAAHTQRFADRNNENVRIDVLDGSAQQAAGSSQEVGAGTTAQNFACDETFDAASKSYGARLVVVNNALLIPTSGAIKWTKLIDDGANVTVNGAGDEAERQSFFTADPRLSGKAGDGSAGFHFQVNRASFDTSFHEPSMQGLAPDSMQAAIIIFNARGEGVNGLSVTLTADPTNPGSTVTLNTTTSTQDGQAGVTGLIDVCPSGKPGGAWALAADITAPAAIDHADYFLTNTSTITVILDDPRISLRCEGGDPATPLDHWRPGKQLVVGIAAVRMEGNVGSQTATRVAYDTNSARFFVASFNPALGRLESLASDEQTWEVTDTPHLFTPTISAGDSKLGLYTFDAADTGLWGNRSVFVEGYALVSGVPKIGGGTVEMSGDKNRHDRYAFDGPGFVGFPTR